MTDTLDKQTVLEVLKERMLEYDRKCWLDTTHAIAELVELISEGDYDTQEPTVTLSDGTEAKVGDKVINVNAGHIATIIGFELQPRLKFEDDSIGVQDTKSRFKAYTEPDSWEKLYAYMDNRVGSSWLNTDSDEVITRAKALATQDKEVK